MTMIAILMMSAKLATPGLLEIKAFWNKDHNFIKIKIIISVCDVTKFLFRDLNSIVKVFIWPKFGNSTISMKEVIITSIL